MENPWILTTPARPARPNVPVFHPRITVSEFIKEDSKERDVEILEKFVAQEDTFDSKFSHKLIFTI